MAGSILIVDDDARIRRSLTQGLLRVAGEVRAVEGAESALSFLAQSPADVVLADVRMPGMDGLELLRILRERFPRVSVIMMTAFDDLPTVAKAMQEGAVDFLVKPLDLHQLRRVVERVFEDQEARQRGRQEPAAQGEGEPFRLLGHDPAMIEIFKIVGQVAASRASVVIRGESGTGKELVARAIHANSPYATEPFVPVNCTALPETHAPSIRIPSDQLVAGRASDDGWGIGVARGSPPGSRLRRPGRPPSRSSSCWALAFRASALPAFGTPHQVSPTRKPFSSRMSRPGPSP